MVIEIGGSIAGEQRLSFNQGDFAIRVNLIGSISLMCIVDPSHLFRRLDCRNVEVDDDGFLAASHENAFERLVGAGVDLLVRNVRRNVDEVAGSGFGGELELIAPTHASAAFDDIDDAFNLAVMMSSSLGVWMYGDGSGP